MKKYDIVFAGLLMMSAVSVVDAAVAVQKTPCSTGQSSCYRCVKPGRYGFHLYPRQLERSTCNERTVRDLRNAGYRCVLPYSETHCVRNSQK